MATFVALALALLVLRAVLPDMRPAAVVLAGLVVLWFAVRVLPDAFTALSGPLLLGALCAAGLWLMVRSFFR